MNSQRLFFMRIKALKKVITLLAAFLFVVALPMNAANVEILSGDINDDTKVDIQDVNDIIDILLQDAQDSWMYPRADVNGDGKVNIEDVNDIIDVLLDPQKVFSILMSQDSAVMNVKETLELTAAVYTATSGRTIEWSSSDESVATVDNGSIMAKLAGECDIIASCCGKQAVCHVVVEGYGPDSVVLSADSAMLEVSKSLRLRATIYPNSVFDKLITWSTTDADVATVTAYGLSATVTAVSPGECDIIAACGSKKAVCHISVEAAAPDSVILNMDSAILEVSEYIVLDAAIYPEGVFDDFVSWTSTDADIATVDASGLNAKVTAVSVGECDVIADCKGVQAVCHIQVQEAIPVSVTLNMNTATLNVAESMALSAVIYPEGVFDQEITWTSSDANVATVDASGLNARVTAVSAGECDVIADCRGVQAMCHIKVEDVIPDSVTLSRYSATLEVSKRLMLKATVYPEGTFDDALTWTTTDADIAVVSPSGLSATVTAVSPGECDVIADCKGVKAVCHVTVNQLTLNSITLSDEYVTMKNNETKTLTATLNPSGIDASTIQWSSSNTSIAKVNNGVVTALATGICEITARCQDKQASCVVAVVKEIDVNGVSFIMVPVKGGTFTMGATYDQVGADANERPPHQVTVSDYMIGQTEVTQELWTIVMGYTPGYFKGYPQHPVENVTWEDCSLFVDKLNEMTGLNFHLPTEAQWEYAAHGGNRSMGYKYSGSNNAAEVGWFANNSGSLPSTDPDYGPHDVATKNPNELLIYDMCGNVNEWCNDWYSPYTSQSQTDPTGPSTGSYKVYRGGSWMDPILECRITFRYMQTTVFKNDRMGLRLAL